MSLLRSVELKRKRVGGSWVDGRWIVGEAAETVFFGTVQPTSGANMQLLPEGKRDNESLTFFAPIDVDFLTADDKAQTAGDKIVWGSKEFEVVVAKKWDNGLLPHWELVCVKQKEGANDGA